jgi:hypothetical protein
MAGPASLTATVDAACAALSAGLSAVAASPTAPGTVAEWAAAMAALQRLLDVATAAQDVTICRLASIEVDVAEDGTLLERHRPPGHIALDAAPVVSGVLGATSVHAERRVRAAVARVADGPPGTGAATGFGGLHAAMAAGRLDPYRADVVAAELEEAPAEVVATVVAALEPYLDTETGPQLRRRCRRLLARVSPDLLRQRARRARAGSRLERWASEPGVDTWHGTFPSEEAALAWAAVDALAQRYVADGTCATVDRARARALTDLVTGNADVSADVVLTVPHPDAEPGTLSEHPDDLVEVPGLRPSEPLLVRRGWLGGLTRAAAATTPSRRAARRLRVRACHPGTGAAIADLPPADLRPTDRPPTDPVQTDRPPTGVPRAPASVADARGPRRGSDAGPYRLTPARGRAGPVPRRALPLPRLPRLRPVLRPRPRPSLAERPHDGRQPHVPVPSPPPHQAAARLARPHPRRRHRRVDRPHRPHPHHPPPRHPPPRGAPPRAR